MTAKHRVVIEPGSGSQNYWGDLWQYRGLLLFLAWRDLAVRYKQTTIGVLWAVVRPLLTIGAMWFIGWLFGSNVPEGTPRILIVCAATLPWQFFATSFSNGQFAGCQFQPAHQGLLPPVDPAVQHRAR